MKREGVASSLRFIARARQRAEVIADTSILPLAGN